MVPVFYKLDLSSWTCKPTSTSIGSFQCFVEMGYNKQLSPQEKGFPTSPFSSLDMLSKYEDSCGSSFKPVIFRFPLHMTWKKTGLTSLSFFCCWFQRAQKHQMFFKKPFLKKNCKLFYAVLLLLLLAISVHCDEHRTQQTAGPCPKGITIWYLTIGRGSEELAEGRKGKMCSWLLSACNQSRSTLIEASIRSWIWQGKVSLPCSSRITGGPRRRGLAF